MSLNTLSKITQAWVATAVDGDRLFESGDWHGSGDTLHCKSALAPLAVGLTKMETQTWVTNSDPFSLNAYANSNTPGANGSLCLGCRRALPLKLDTWCWRSAPTDNVDGFDVSVT